MADLSQERIDAAAERVWRVLYGPRSVESWAEAHPKVQEHCRDIVVAAGVAELEAERDRLDGELVQTGAEELRKRVDELTVELADRVAAEADTKVLIDQLSAENARLRGALTDLCDAITPDLVPISRLLVVDEDAELQQTMNVIAVARAVLAGDDTMSTSSESLIDALTHVLNVHSTENESDTPDFILAQFLLSVLDAWNAAMKRRAMWFDPECSDVAEGAGETTPPVGEEPR